MPDEELLKSYEAARSKGSSLALAELEANVVAQASVTRKELGDRRYFLQRLFGGRAVDYEGRWTIYRCGSWAFPLFDRMDRGVKINTVLVQLRTAKEEARANGTDPGEVLARILATGSIAPRPKRRRIVTGSVPPKERPSTNDPETMTTASKKFRIGVEALAESFMDTMFKGLDEGQKNQLNSDFKMSLGQLLDEFRVRATKTKRDVKAYGLKRIGIDHFKWACEVFGLSTRFGQYVNFKRVGRLKIKRLRGLHADRNPSEAARHEYDAVNKAFEILRAYCANQLTKGRVDDQDQNE